MHQHKINLSHLFKPNLNETLKVHKNLDNNLALIKLFPGISEIRDIKTGARNYQAMSKIVLNYLEFHVSKRIKEDKYLSNEIMNELYLFSFMACDVR